MHNRIANVTAHKQTGNLREPSFSGFVGYFRLTSISLSSKTQLCRWNFDDVILSAKSTTLSKFQRQSLIFDNSEIDDNRM